MSRTVLVLTATGTIGSQAVAALSRAGALVRGATRTPEKAAPLDNVTFVPWSYDDPSTWDAALAGVDALFLAMPAFREDELALGTAILEAAKRAGVRRIVKLSAAGVEGNPDSGHRRVELAIEGSGLSWIHLRPSFFHENFIEFYGATVRSDSAIYLPAGKGRTGFVAAADVGEAAAAALLGDATGEAWTLTGPESLDHDEVAAILGAVLGREIRYVDVPPQAFADTLRSYGASELAVATMSGLYDFVRAGWTAGLSPDVERVTGRAPLALSAWAQAHAAAW